MDKVYIVIEKYEGFPLEFFSSRSKAEAWREEQYEKREWDREYGDLDIVEREVK